MIPESLAWALSFATPFAVLLSLADWTYSDARARGSSRAWLWGVAVLFVFAVAVPHFLVRHDLGERESPPSAGQRAATVFIVGAIIATRSRSSSRPPLREYESTRSVSSSDWVSRQCSLTPIYSPSFASTARTEQYDSPGSLVR